MTKSKFEALLDVVSFVFFKFSFIYYDEFVAKEFRFLRTFIGLRSMH